MKGWSLLAGMLTISTGTATMAEVTLFDNFGDDDAYDIGAGWTLSDGSPLDVDRDQGDAFTVTGGDFYLESMQLAVGLVMGANRLYLDVYDDAGGAPGAVLESIIVEGQMGQFGDENPLLIGGFSGSTVLEENAQYWIVASTDDDTWASWSYNVVDDLGPHAFRADLGEWETALAPRGAFRVTGSLVPAPAALSLLALVGVTPARRRRRR